MSNQLCDFEMQLLRSMCGLEPPMPWGAAVSVALESLTGRGLAHLVPCAAGAIYKATGEGERVARGEA